MGAGFSAPACSRAPPLREIGRVCAHDRAKYLGLPRDELGVQRVLDIVHSLGRRLGREVHGGDRRGDRHQGDQASCAPRQHQNDP